MSSTDTTQGRKTALITGASGGIGYELARIFAREGYNLVLVARTESKLAQIKGDFEKKHGISVKVLAKDLADPSAPQEIFSELQAEAISVDALVNNAGFTVYGPFAETSLEKELELLQVNMVALTHLTKLFLPGMIEKGWGKVLNVASTAAFQPGPLMACYYASKAYVLYFSEALAAELEGKGVTVTALCPGPTETGFQKRGNMEDSKLVAGRKIMDARTVAKAGYRALMKGQPVVVPGLRNWVMAEAIRFIPRKMVARIVGRAQERI
ncbi:MAG TPA: SDR family oxidoreductase [Chloroflexia bacterium]|nr:SDR family oxidoreductase [Chloroflexia bacterium]